MRKIMKRGFCLFLVAVLLAGLVPCAFADEAMPTEEVGASEAATEAAEETTAPPETAVPSESTEPPSETTELPEATETTESETEVTGLNAGTYYVKELGHTNSAISSRYTCSGENPKMVSISNGTTTSVSFYNKLTVGALEIRKSTNTGNHLDGWKFIVKKDGTEIPGSPFTTDETGIIRISNLAPGKYVILESPTDDPYWTAELGYHTVTVEYGKTAVDRWLNKEQGLGHFTKSTNTGDEISGWHITVYADEACTQELRTLITGQDGTVGVYLEPGTYWVKETGSEEVRDDYWKMDDSVKKLVIRSHEKTTLEFINNYSGRISIQKTVKPERSLLCHRPYRQGSRCHRLYPRHHGQVLRTHHGQGFGGGHLHRHRNPDG